MPFDLSSFNKLYDRLYQVDFPGTLPKVRPNLSTMARIRSATGKGASFLPLLYRQQYYSPLDASLPDFLTQLQDAIARGKLDANGAASALEPFYAPIYQHGGGVTDPDVRDALARFL